jgi:opacity protein-like surface antigen
MRITDTPFVRYAIVVIVLSTAVCVSPSLCSAQGFGVGGRIAWVTADSDADLDSVRFNGGQIRLLTGRWGFEVSIDRNSESFEELNQKVTATPIQASLLLRMGGSKVSPFLLGGRGWYRRKVELIDGPDEPDVETTETGWHAGGGLEIFAGRHVGIHGDYRYTFLNFGDDDDDDDDDDEGFIGGLIPGHRGSMWTIGATIYF